MSRLSFTIVLALGLAVGACDRGAADKAQETPAASVAVAAGTIDRSRAGELMPAANLRDPAGRVLNLGALQGTPVLLNLWATWCAPCVKEMPLLDQVAADYDEQVHVITASQDLGAPEKVAAFFAERELRYLEPWIDPEAGLSTTLGEGSLPTTVLYDAQGLEVWRVRGDLDWSREDVRDAIEEAIPLQE
ncbi:TlpA family protein disulfide reductase [Qipengyuania sp.]|uniref:TlpA family protein disulfide reductase n=1 Tax=Qipengyuania sp. TaxID=2004515 RepID=UPI0037360F89